MLAQIRLFPEQASTIAAEIDNLYSFIVGITVAISAVTAVLLIYFAIRYRRRRVDEVGPVIHGSMALELVWTGIPLLIVLVMFGWSASLFFGYAIAPADAIDIYVTGRQWMWKVQHPDGQREINELHVPVNQPVRLLLTSEDVIHSFFVPEFRVKQDALPGRYTTLWFQATKPGVYHLLCTEYCGTDHSLMVGKVIVGDAASHQQWLSSKADLSLALRGRQLFLKFQCVSCHGADADARGPRLENLYRTRRPLADGSSVNVDESYYIESIRNPRAKVAAGYQPIMPPFTDDQMKPDELLAVLAFLKSAKSGDIPSRNEQASPPAVDPSTGKPKEGENK